MEERSDGMGEAKCELAATGRGQQDSEHDGATLIAAHSLAHLFPDPRSTYPTSEHEYIRHR